MRTYLLHTAAAAAALALTFSLAAPARAQTTYEQLTDDSGDSGCGSFAPAAGTNDFFAFESTCDPADNNGDGSREIFRYRADTQAFQQLTEAEGCASASPSANAAVTRIAFESDCDFTGGNADGNTEIFLWKQGTGVLQLTSTTACDNLSPTITSGASNAVVGFDSNCTTLSPTNVDGSSEIYTVTETAVVTQLTSDTSGECDSINPSANGAGTLFAFESDCDLLGSNPDFAIEIFTVTNQKAVKQLTSAGDDACSSISPALSSNGSFVAFESDCDFVDENDDAGVEIFRAQVSNGAVVQLTDDSEGSSCASTQPVISSNGAVVAFSSFCDLAGDNGDDSLEVFRVGASASGPEDLVQVTAGTGCNSLAGSIDSAGDKVYLDSDCDLAGANEDESSEIFSAVALINCVCGAPISRETPPKASDALAVLKGAVGAAVCPLCACDTDDNGSVVASDALRVLRKAVGGVDPLDCPAP